MKKKIGILNKGKNNGFISNTFVGLDVGIQDEGENTIAERNRFLSFFQNPMTPNWQKWGTILTGLSILVALGWGMFIYFFPPHSDQVPTGDTVQINESKGIIFEDSVIQGGASVSESEGVEFKKTRITK